MELKPGVHRNIDLGYLYKGEANIVLMLAEVWFITFVRNEVFKGSKYSIAFARSTSELDKQFHFSREILVVLTPYSDYHATTMDFVDRLMTEYQNRLDKLFVILISRDRRIMEKIKNAQSQDSDSRVVIPFTYDELLTPDNSAELIKKRLRMFFASRDLFDQQSPLKNESLFFGRDEVIQQVYGRYKAGENSGMFGLRRVGKTSLLHAVKRMLEINKEPSVIIDCSDTSLYLQRWYKVLEDIILQFISSYELNSMDYDAHHGYTELTATRSFDQDLKKLKASFLGNRVLIMLDEVENISYSLSPGPHWTEENDFIYFWQTIRYVFQRDPSLFGFIVAGVNPKCSEMGTIKSFDNPLFRLFTPTYLTFFNYQQVKYMMTSIGSYMGIEFDEEFFAYLVDAYGGHPFLTRQVGSLIHRLLPSGRPARVTGRFFRERRPAFDKALGDYVEQILGVLKRYYEVEHDLLEHLAVGNSEKFHEVVAMAPSVTEHLKGYGLLVEDNGRYYFNIGVVEAYLCQAAQTPKILTSREEAWREITVARGTIERKLRYLVGMVLKVEFGTNGAKAKFVELLGKATQKEACAGLSINEILDPSTKAEVYWMDLCNTVQKYWSVFQNVFIDKANFVAHMTHLNSMRVDAHAKDISDEQLTQFRTSMQWIKTRIDAFIPQVP